MVPPAWLKMKRMSGQRLSVPPNNRLAMVRVVSVPNSIAGSGMPGTMLTQQLGAVGCTNTTALRRLSSSITGRKMRSPSHLSSP